MAVERWKAPHDWFPMARVEPGTYDQVRVLRTRPGMTPQKTLTQ
jgi:hypothetical protein